MRIMIHSHLSAFLVWSAVCWLSGFVGGFCLAAWVGRKR
jgi:hypothetical protein